MATKTCNYCGKELELTAEFWPMSKGKINGARCRKCCSVASVVSRQKNKAATNASNKAWKLRNKEQNAQINKIWREANIDKNRKAGLLWAKNNPDKHNAKYAKRRASKLQRTPAWLTLDDKLLIEAKYATAKWLSGVVGVPYHVDHIYPLAGNEVSGLHVPNNLCVLLGTENLSKGNKLYG